MTDYRLAIIIVILFRFSQPSVRSKCFGSDSHLGGLHEINKFQGSDWIDGLGDFMLDGSTSSWKALAVT